MNDIEMNAIFYSKGNIELAYSLKKACRNINANVFNVIQFTELIYRLNDTSTSIVFLDYDNMEGVSSVLDFILNYNFNEYLSVVVITDKETPEIDFSKQNFYKISPLNLQNDLYFIEHKLKYTSALRRNIDCNLNELGEEVTDYLIVNGFSPQHKGFAYIKECIMFVVTQRGALGSLSSEVYPYVATKFNTVVENVERNIRNAILQAKKINFKNNDICKLTSGTRLSNKVVLGYLVDRSLNNIKKA